MFEKLEFNMNKVYPTLVVSTMSSGKSTLINALVGTELLPSMNRACTARAVAILDNDWKSQFEIHAIDKTGAYSKIERATKRIVRDFNESKKVSEMIIEGEIKGIKNSKKSLLMIDTPGINNSMDLSHEVVTREVLDEYPEGLIIYIIDAHQIGTNDDKHFLSFIARKIKDNEKFKIIFAVNKMDLIDPIEENPIKLMNSCKKYVTDTGIENPILIPVSASSALIFKKVLAEATLTEFEEEEFQKNYKHFKREGFSLQDYMYIPKNGDLNASVSVAGVIYKRAQILAALENTGIPHLEKTIDEMLVRSLKMKPPKITVKKEEKKTVAKNTSRKQRSRKK